MTITTTLYKSLDDAYAYFNEKLFDGKLPECIITLQRSPRTLGYYHHNKFRGRNGEGELSELALNPDGFYERDDVDILSTLLHEMCHVYQYTLPDPPRKGYHDREFSEIMFERGLQTSSTGTFGGKTTGQSMSHYIIDGGRFEIVCGAFLLGGSKLVWNSVPSVKTSKERKKTRYKYTCPQCMFNMWGKKDAEVGCWKCMKKMVVEEED